MRIFYVYLQNERMLSHIMRKHTSARESISYKLELI